MFFRHFADARQTRDPIPLWLKEFCSAMGRDSNFIQGTGYCNDGWNLGDYGTNVWVVQQRNEEAIK